MANGTAPQGVPEAGPQVVQTGSKRILCVADIRGNLKSLNEMAAQSRADYVIHTGDFGFYDEESLKRIADKYVLDVFGD